MTKDADEYAHLCERYVERNPAVMGPVRTVAGLIEQRAPLKAGAVHSDRGRLPVPLQAGQAAPV